ncbi:dephospho-CoA kinase [Selenomonas sp. TAMA-11512]|uniref:dephospho-CoA kinase n=1 Tax=Selenomonas sp. TAMA-11512 TaxID=3095337 RepID=UPI0030CC572A
MKSLRKDVYLIGITGGIAGGKSTVSARLRELGAAVLDTDAIAHELAEPGGALWHAYVTHFGEEILKSDKTLDRQAIGAKIFADAKERAWINATAHPLIQAELEKQIATAVKQGSQIIFLEVPLLFEAGWDRSVHAIWVVDIDEKTQLERLMKRDEIHRTAAEKKIQAQLSIKEKRKRADLIIDNSKDRKSVGIEIEKAYNSVLNSICIGSV